MSEVHSSDEIPLRTPYRPLDRKPIPTVDSTDANGIPLKATVNGFNRANEAYEQNTVESLLKKLAPKIDEIKQLFMAGDVRQLTAIAAKTAPVAYKYNKEYSLEDAQVLNDYAYRALNWLVGENFARGLGYDYRTHLGQNTADTDALRYFAAAGIFDTEGDKSASESAIAEMLAKNPLDADVLKAQGTVASSIMKMLDEKDSEAAKKDKQE